MIKKMMIFLFAVISMHITYIHAGAQENIDSLPGLKIGTKAPDFQLHTIEGNTVKLSDYQGKKVMINFWATWCPPCKAEMPELQKLYNEMGNEVVILAVNIDPRNNVKEYAEKMKLTFPILLDEGDQINNKYQVMAIPTSYFIDNNGIIQHKYLSAMPYEKMKEFITKM